MTIGYDRTKPASSIQEADFDDLRDFFENSSVGMHWVGADGTILRANRADYEPLGYAADDYVGQDVRAFHADPAVASEILARLSRGERIENQPARLVRRDGSIRHVLIDSNALIRDGEFVHARSIVRDDTERVRAEQALRMNEQSSAALADLLPVLLSYVDKERRYVYNNRAYEDWFGQSRAEVTGRTLDDVLGEEACRVMAPYVDAVMRGERVTYESQVPFRDGGSRWVRASYVPHRTAQGVQGFVAIVEDITERRLADEGLRASEERYRTLADALPSYVGQFDSEGRAGYVNDRWLELTGRSQEQMTGFGWTEVVHREDLPAIQEELRAAAAEGRQAQFEYRVRAADGSWRWFLGSTAPVRAPDGTTATWIGASTDITDRKLAETALRESERRYRELVSAIDVAIYTTDAKGLITQYNAAAVSLWGRAPKIGVERWSGSKLFWPDGRPMADEESPLALTLKHARAVRGFEAISERPDGSRVHFIPYPTPLHDSSGRLVGAVNVLVDITERKRAERELYATQAQWRALTEQNPSLIVLTDAAGAAIHFNPAWKEYFALEDDELRGWLWAELVHPEDRDRLKDDWAAAWTRGDAFTCEYRAKRHDGEDRWFRATMSPVRDQTGTITNWIAVSIDVHEEKTGSEELRRSEARQRAILDTAVDGIITIDESGTIESFNPAAERLFGYAADEAVGRNIKMLMPDAYAAGHDQYLANYLLTGVQKIIGSGRDVEAQRKDGSTFPIGLSVSEVNVGEARSFTGIVHDLTERKKAEEALRESEERFRGLADSAPVLIWMAGVDKLCTYFNKPWLEFRGRTLGEEIGEGWADGVHPEDLAPCVETYERAFDRREPYEMEYRLLHNSGAYRWIVDRGVPMYLPDGTFTGYIGGCIDIDDRKRADEAVRESEARYRSLVDTMPALVVATSTDGEFEEISESYEAYTGLSLEQAKEWQTYQVIHPDDFDRAMDVWAQALRTGEPMHNEMRLRRHDGAYRWFITEGLPVRGADGSIARWITVSIDVDDRRRAEEAEREQRALIDAMFHALPIGLTYVDRDYRFVRINEALAEINGLNAAAHEGKSVAEVAPEIFPVLKPLLDRALAGESINNVELSADAPGAAEGLRHWIAGFHPVQSATGEVVGVAESVVEITERKRMEDALTYQFGLTSTITDNASVGLLMMDREGRITFLNSAGELITGYRFDDVHGENAHDMFHSLYPDGRPYPLRDCPIQQANEASTMLTDYDDVFVRPDGSFYNVRCNVAPIVREDEQIGALVEIRDVTEEKRAEARARFLLESSEALNTSLDYEQMLAEMAERAVPTVADIAVVGVFGHGPATIRFGTALADPEQRELVARVHLRRWPAGDGSGRTIEDLMLAGETLLIADAPAWIEAHAPNDEQRDLAGRLGTRSLISAPLMVRGEAAGMMTFSVGRSGRRFGELDRVMIAELARRAGLALENARLYSELQETAARERLLSEARRVLGESLDEDQQLASLCALAVPAAADICLITRFEPDGRTVLHFGPEGATDAERVCFSRLRLREWRPPGADRDVGALLAAQLPVFVADAAAWADTGAPDEAQRDAALELRLRSLIAVPVRSQNALMGALIWLRRAGSAAYDARDVALAEEIARRAGTAVENARLYRAVQDAAARARFLADARELMTRSLDEHETLEALVGLLVPAMADWATVVSRGESGTFELRATRFADERYAHFSDISTVVLDATATAGAQQVIHERRSLLIRELSDDVFEAISDPNLRAMAKATPTRSALIVPIGADSALAVASMRPGRYSDVDVELMEQFAAHATAGLRNARLYGDLQKTAADLERANAAKDEFLGLVSHELKTPITTIYGNAEVLQRRAGELPMDVQASALGDIRIESERLHRIVDNLLVLARLEQGQRLESEPTLVRRIINRVIQEHRRRFPGRAIELHHDEKLIPALASPEYTEQVVRNLLSNAEKYSPRESVIEVHIGKEDEDLVVRVLDRGQGIDESELENVFTPFYRSPANSPAAPGAGIGLAVCKRLVEAQSGRIWAKRRDGGGSEFGFSVPIADDDGS